MRTSSGIYVEIEIQDDLDHVWLLTQDPAFHERWDLRFSVGVGGTHLFIAAGL